MAFYGTLIEADAFFQNRLKADAWTDSALTDRTKAMEMATQRIDQLNFIGKKKVSTQELEFPRDITGVDVPIQIEKATYLVALSLLDEVDIEEEIKNLQATSRIYAGVRTSYDRMSIPDYLASGIPSTEAWSYLKPFLRDPNDVNLARIN